MNIPTFLTIVFLVAANLINTFGVMTAKNEIRKLIVRIEVLEKGK